jgi:hypothetical protein
MALMNISEEEVVQEGAMPSEGGSIMEPSMEEPSSGGMMIPDDGGVDEEEYKEDILENLEAHLNSLPDEAKEFLSQYAVTPEFATAIGIINGPEVGEYFMRYADPSKTVVVQDVPQEQMAPPQPNMAQAAPAAPAGQPPAQSGGIMQPAIT